MHAVTRVALTDYIPRPSRWVGQDQARTNEREHPETGMPTFDVLFMGWGEGNPTQPASIVDKLLSTDSTARYLPYIQAASVSCIPP